MIKVFVQIKNALESGTLKKMEEVSEEEQKKYRTEFIKLFSKHYFEGNEGETDLKHILRFVSKRNLL